MSLVFFVLVPFRYILILLAIIAIIYIVFRFWKISFIVIILIFSMFSKEGKIKPTTTLSTSPEKKRLFFDGNRNRVSFGTYSPFYVLNSLKGKCSGFVINDEYLVTAYHCVKKRDYIRLNNPDFKNNDRRREQEGIVVEINKEFDLALIKGSFHDVQKFYLNNSSDYKGITFEACGAPKHRKIIDCFKVKNVELTNDYFIGEGFSRPGMSGGALVDRNLKIILGVLVGSNENKTFYVRIDKVFEIFGLSHEEVNRSIHL